MITIRKAETEHMGRRHIFIAWESKTLGGDRRIWQDLRHTKAGDTLKQKEPSRKPAKLEYLESKEAEQDL